MQQAVFDRVSFDMVQVSEFSFLRYELAGRPVRWLPGQPRKFLGFYDKSNFQNPHLDSQKVLDLNNRYSGLFYSALYLSGVVPRIVNIATKVSKIVL